MGRAEFCGRLDRFPLMEVINLIRHSRRTGNLRIQCGDHEGDVEFHNGRIVRASTSRGYQDIGTILLDLEAITDRQLQEAAQKQSDEENYVPLGRLLVALGFAVDEDVHRAMREQVSQVMDDLLKHGEGNFDFSAVGEPTDDITQDVSDIYVDTMLRRRGA